MRNKLLSGASAIGRQYDLMLIFVFATILLMMILPLPSLLMDLLITLNITASVIILIMALQLKEPVHFTTFPSLLLLTTLFRLAISISTTRLILLEGSAGQIVETFGNVVVGGNLVVGLVIFLIITVVQFLVITKGADRVAEVGARFTLDGMPGKQMAVDADVRAGNIDQAAAKITRSNLERETKLFGAMDGAMKFVKGDAVAGLVITAINLIGGVAIGMSQLGFSFSEAITLYSLLTIGDGLVAQIPALLISVSAGTMVTRVTNPNGASLATEISEQVIENRKNLMVAGVGIALFGFIPGFPTFIFVTVGMGITLGVAWNISLLKKSEAEQRLTWEGLLQENHNWCETEAAKGQETVKLVIKLPQALFKEDPEEFYTHLDNVRTVSHHQFGVPTGLWRLEFNRENPECYSFAIQGETVHTERMDPELLFVKASPPFLESLDIPSRYHFGDEEAALVHVSYLPKLNEERMTSYEASTMLLMDIRSTIAESLHLFIDSQSTMYILNQIKPSNPNLVKELVENLTITQISNILQLMVKERLPLIARNRIFEAILDWGQKRTDPYEILQQVRLSISAFLNDRYATDGLLQAIIIAPTLEGFIREGFRTSEDQRYLLVENSISAHLAQRVKELTTNYSVRGKSPVIVTQQDVRRAIFNVLQQHGQHVTVLAYQEIAPETTIYPIGFVGPEEQWEGAA